MLDDARTLEADTRIECDLCIVGGGAAGISLARELSATRLRVVVLESGGLEPDAEAQALCAGRGIGLGGDGYLMASRLRGLGGSTAHWYAACAPLDPQDFEPRPWVPHSGWPLSRADLEPHYARAQAICGVGPWSYDVADWDPEPALPLGPRTTRRMWQLGDRRHFGRAYGDELRASANVRVLLHATAVELATDAAGRRVETVAVRTPGGGRLEIAPRGVALAAGGIENPRLLLASDRAHPAGLGNPHDRVGRFFAEHPHCQYSGAILTPDWNTLRWGKKRRAHDTNFRLNLGLSAETQRQERLLNGSLSFYESGRVEDELEPALLALLRDVSERSAPDALARASLFARFEQAPNPESRVTLDTERDALGLPRVVLDWRLSPLDLESMRRTLEILAEDLGGAGAARVRIADWLANRELVVFGKNLIGGAHHMGTTRMSDDSREGVVDRNARVHGVTNLWVAGSSVFPTSGWANPTLTIVALALRLADRLRSELGA